MHLLGCLDRPTSGEYVLNGHDVAHLSNRQLARVRNRDIGFVFQGFNLLRRTSALENVELPLIYTRGVSGRERRERAIAALGAVGLGDRLGHSSNQLSGRQQQRVADCAGAGQQSDAAARRRTYRESGFTHEPGGGGDLPATQHGPLTILLVTHERDIAQYASRLVSFLDGRVRSDEPVGSQRIASVDLAAMAADAQSRPLSA
jgi:putative ABC transport system ATP-binding protein